MSWRCAICKDGRSRSTHEYGEAPERKGGETGDPRENPPTSGIVRRDSHMRKSRSNPSVLHCADDRHGVSTSRLLHSMCPSTLIIIGVRTGFWQFARWPPQRHCEALINAPQYPVCGLTSTINVRTTSIFVKGALMVSLVNENHQFDNAMHVEESRLDEEQQSMLNVFALTTTPSSAHANEGYESTSTYTILQVLRTSNVQELPESIEDNQTENVACEQNVNIELDFAEHRRDENQPLSTHMEHLKVCETLTIMYLKKKEKGKKEEEKKRKKVVNELNISFTKLGHEERGTCFKFKEHDKDHNKKNLSPDCETCIYWQCRIEKAEKSRDLYKEHAKLQSSTDTTYFCDDLQKVIILPKMDTFKEVVFSLRMAVFNESFAPLGIKLAKPLAVLCPEATNMRKEKRRNK
ncbi:hypothetical protein PR048_010380 [Dryococelus australis]|uniref:Uncharacterized protein n=1 Tax=Dryococelus australis TaxID=614101 RepID=A0ABQ9I3E4_9NEOP|nr:hypothetical protein PR048_010380 [Dryococelus australis]